MIIISKNTEIILRKDMKKLAREGERAYCFYIAFSRILLDKSHWFEPLVASLKNYVEVDAIKLYLCCDHDVFIAAPSMTEKTFQILCHDLARNIRYPALLDYCGSFNLNRDWRKLDVLYDKKINAYLARRARAERERKPDITLDANLIDSLAERRMQSKNQSILIVDDDQLSRTLTKGLLDKSYDLQFAVDGHEAVSKYVSYAPDVLFLDIGLPDMSGHDVLEQILEIDPDAYIVMFSGRQDESNVRRAIASGARGYVVKPFSRKKLLDYTQKSPFIQAKCYVG